MFTDKHAMRFHKYKFDTYQAEAKRARRRRRYWGLNDLPGALAGRLASLGIKGRDGELYPASPAY